MSDRTTYARAAAGYDPDHEAALFAAITAAIVDISMVTDCDAVVLRTGELTSALLTALAGALLMSPAATRSPTQIRKTVDELHKRLRRQVAEAEQNADLQDFASRCFRGDRTEGNA
jgi:hypothetical protein